MSVCTLPTSIPGVNGVPTVNQEGYYPYIAKKWAGTDENGNDLFYPVWNVHYLGIDTKHRTKVVLPANNGEAKFLFVNLEALKPNKELTRFASDAFIKESDLALFTPVNIVAYDGLMHYGMVSEIHGPSVQQTVRTGREKWGIRVLTYAKVILFSDDRILQIPPKEMDKIQGCGGSYYVN